MTQKELAQALGISAGMVSRLAKRGMPTDDLERAKRWRKRHLEPGRVKGVKRDPQTIQAMQKQHKTLLAQAVAEAKRSAGPPLRDALPCFDEALAAIRSAHAIPDAAAQALYQKFFAELVTRLGGLDAAKLPWWDWCALLPQEAAENEALAEHLESTCTQPVTLVEFNQAMQPLSPLPLDTLRAAFLRF